MLSCFIMLAAKVNSSKAVTSLTTFYDSKTVNQGFIDPGRGI